LRRWGPLCDGDRSAPCSSTPEARQSSKVPSTSCGFPCGSRIHFSRQVATFSRRQKSRSLRDEIQTRVREPGLLRPFLRSTVIALRHSTFSRICPFHERAEMTSITKGVSYGVFRISNCRLAVYRCRRCGGHFPAAFREEEAEIVARLRTAFPAGIRRPSKGRRGRRIPPNPPLELTDS